MDQHIEAADDRRSESGDSGYDESMISTASLSSSMYGMSHRMTWCEGLDQT